jgi:chromosome segregation ATPase
MSMSDQSGRLHQAIIKQALADAQARIAELERALKDIKRHHNFAYLNQLDSEIDELTKERDALQAKLAGLAGEAVEFAKFVKAEIESLPIGFKQTIVVAVDGKHQVRSLLDLLERVDGFIHDHAAADLVAAAVGERCEENTNRENDDATS